MRMFCQIAGEILFTEVCCIDYRLCGEQRCFFQPFLFFFGHIECTGRFSLFEVSLELFQEVQLILQLFVPLEGFFYTVDSAVQHIQIGKNQFQIDGFNISCRVDAAVNVNNVDILKAADNVDNRIHFPNISEEFIAQTFALRSTLYQTSDVNKFEGCRGEFIRFIDFCQFIQTAIRY